MSSVPGYGVGENESVLNTKNASILPKLEYKRCFGSSLNEIFNWSWKFDSLSDQYERELRCLEFINLVGDAPTLDYL